MSESVSAGSSKLYSPRLLALSASLAAFPFDERFAQIADANSRTCGSTMRLGIDLDAEGRVERIGMQVSACAVGQSSAAILAQGIDGATLHQLNEHLAAIEAWLEGTGELPDFPEFEALEPAKPHKGRHEALLLPWKAAKEALSLGATSR